MAESVSDACGAPPDEPGARLTGAGVEFGVASLHAESIFVCLFDAQDRETARVKLAQRTDDLHYGFVPGLCAGQRYGLRADGPWDLRAGHRFDPQKLLVDPYATRLDRPFVFDPALALARDRAVDTARLIPKAIVEAAPAAVPAQAARDPRLIYEVCVKAHTMRDERVPPVLRGTLAGLVQPHAIARMVELGVSHVELMPVAAWIDERHLTALGLRNAWGYNPVTMMALDPRLAPGGMADLSATVAALRAAGIGVLLDVVYNHSGESDADGPTLSLRGLDNATYYRHADGGALINDTGCGNSLDCTQPIVVRLIVDTLRRFVTEAGVDGFRFDLAVSLGRRPDGFDPHAPLFAAMAADPVLRDRILIAEPWDIGPGGYQVGRFAPPWREWNDHYRDDTRRFWRGDANIGALATGLAGSSDIFQSPGRKPSASVNFLAAHDGFTLRDLVSYSRKRNQANGEDNRDGNSGEVCWNHGVDGETTDRAIVARRNADLRALLATLFLSRGTPMLTAGDEFGRTQDGNNNAYAQDNETTWLDWANADAELAAFVAALARLRAETPALTEDRFLAGSAAPGAAWADAVWSRADGEGLELADWAHADFIALTLAPVETAGGRAHLAFNRSTATLDWVVPAPAPGSRWRLALDSARGFVGSEEIDGERTACPARSVVMLVEESERDAV